MGVSASDIGPRLIGLCVLLPLVVMVLAGGGWLLAACLFVALMMIFEFAGLILADRSQQGLLIFGLSALLLGSFLMFPFWYAGLLTLLAGGLVWRLSNRISALFCLFLIACIFGLFALIKGPEGQAMLIVLALVIAAVDSGAWLVGRLLGGPKLAPKISPGKTWSGAAGGTLAGCIAGFFAASWLEAGQLFSLPFIFLLAVLAQIGDLLESAVKRACHKKDSSRMLPGHGGFLDRFDGYLLVVPVVVLCSGGQGAFG